MRVVIGGSLRRRRGPLVRLWSADMRLVHTEPVRVETWRQWAARQWSRLTCRQHRRHVHAAIDMPRHAGA